MKFTSTIFQIYRSFLTIYQRFFKCIYRNLQYINDFLNISIVTCNISTIFLIYRSIDKKRQTGTSFLINKKRAYTFKCRLPPITYLPKNEVTVLIPALNSFHLYGVRIRLYPHQISEGLLYYTYATHSFLL